ncbi:MAG: hypothetical protein A3J66_02850 [Candidatus Magasanikbacteria bacterium RIFCSPHIGHO2_02_FULL_47_14]|uniref:UPF0102 protein A3J66_02850 n=1 Tax=Candidatus Magasanikbacteria bacterium RIFCSPHIGHO2_02_FULL_47_14 TaxID=1798680 RepID=A0A1F6M847_9BACT|nr:MAG: hypothetical protein A3J66_02850 [Candidatus Magasanikbacteria bacterium RIFCSPHIGHO2_02_FULL_47_14]
MEKQLVGKRGEQAAALFLQQKGYEVVGMNYFVRGGEIDIIAWDLSGGEQTLCFVEVKTRKHQDGSAERATNYLKLKRIFRAARFYCVRERIDTSVTPIRFEHVSVCGAEAGGRFEISHYIIPVD